MSGKAKIKNVMAAVAMAAATVSPGAAFAADSGVIGLRAYVPVICHTQFASNVHEVGDGLYTLGALSEFCNASTGYKVVARYDAFGGADGGALIVDGVEVPLSATGETVLADVGGPNLMTRQIGYRLGDAALDNVTIELVVA